MLSGLRATVRFPGTRGHYFSAPPPRRYTSRRSLASTARVPPSIERSPFSSGFVGKESFPTFSHINGARNSVYHGICSSMHRLYKAYLQHQDFSRPPFCFPSSLLIFFRGSWSKWSCWAAPYNFQSPQLLTFHLNCCLVMHRLASISAASSFFDIVGYFGSKHGKGLLGME